MQKHLVLEGEQTIYQARQTHHLLQDALHDGTEITIDLSLISDVDSSFLQILLWLQQEALRLNIKLVLHKPADALMKVSETLGVAKLVQFGGSV